MSRKQTRLTLVVLAIALGLVSAHLFWPAPGGPDLIKRAAKIADVQDALSYNWLSGPELLIKTTTSGTPFVPGKRWRGYIDLINTHTGTRVRMDGLTTAILRDHAGYSSQGPMQFTRSPDGVWMLWERTDPAKGGYQPITARSDGSKYHEWSENFSASSFWIDGSHWASAVMSATPKDIVVHDASRPISDRRVPYASPEWHSLMAIATHQPRLVAESSQRVLDVIGSEDRVTFHVITRPPDIRQTGPITQIDTVSLPSGSQVALDASPDGRRLLFVVQDPRVPNWAALLHRLVPSYSYSGQPIERICAYSLDKRQFIEVGRIDVASPQDPTPIRPTWLPDSTGIEFMYRSAVYAVPIQ